MIEQLRRLFSTKVLQSPLTYPTLERVLNYLLRRSVKFEGTVDLSDANVIGLSSSGATTWQGLGGKPTTFPPSAHTHPISDVVNLQTTLNGKQATLVSGSNIKTINSQSLLGSGDITIAGGVASVNGQSGVVVLDADDIDDTSTAHKFVTSTDITKLSNLSGTNTGDQDLSGKQDVLVSGTNIKTINSLSLLGSGNINTPMSYDGGNASSVYGGTNTINGGDANG